MKSLYHYCRSDSLLPSSNGPLSREVPASAISEANEEVSKVFKDSEDKNARNDGIKSRGTYQKHTPKTRQQSETMESCTEQVLCYAILTTSFQT